MRGGGSRGAVEPGPRTATLLERFPALKPIAAKDPGYVGDILELADRASQFNERYVKPAALPIDGKANERPGYIDWELIKAGLRYDLLSILIPRQLGGLGGLFVLSSLIMEELCSGCAGIANIFGAHMLGIGPIMLSGSLEHMDRYLCEITDAEKRGEPIIMAFAITEPPAGTDVQEPGFLAVGRTVSEARKVPGGYRLSGTKCFISNGSIARYMTVFMPTDRDRPLETWTCFAVDTKRPGFSVGRVEHKMGQRACPAAEVMFDDYFVPEEDVVGGVGRGMLPQTLVVLAASRGPVGAISTGVARGALERFVSWAHEREKGRRPADEEIVQVAIAEMTAQVKVARGAYFDAALSLEFGTLGRVMRTPVTRAMLSAPAFVKTSRPFLRFLRSRTGRAAIDAMMKMIVDEDELTGIFALSSIAKKVGSDTAMSVTRRCLELLGTVDAPVRAELEKCFRDAKLTQIYEGTNELNMLTVYRTLYSGETRIELPRPFGNGRESRRGGRKE